MTFKFLLLQVFVLGLLITRTAAGEVDVYLITGQSNAINFGDEADQGTSDVGFQLHFARTSKTFLPIYTDVAEEFSTNLLNPNRAVTALANQLSLGDVGVFAFARNGSPLAIEAGRTDTWYPGDDPQNGLVKDDSMYGNFITWTNARLAEITAGGDTPVVRGLFWFQGERDGVLGTPGATYQTNFTNLLYRFRQDFGESIPVVGARIREVGSDVANRVAVNQAMENVADIDPLFSLVATDDLSWRSTTDVHLTSAGYFDLASRWSTAMLALQNAPIAWEAARDTTGKADLITGETVVALNAGSEAVTITAAGSSVSFAAADFTNLGSLSFRPTSTGNVVSAHVVENIYDPVAMNSTGDANFDSLIRSLATSDATPDGVTSGTLRLDGLTPGQPYLVQVFANAHDASSLTFGDSNIPENSVVVAGGNSADGLESDDYGQFAVGQFTAQAPSQTISITLDNPGSGPSDATELLTNGGFESPLHSRNDGTDPDGWTVIETGAGSNPDRQVRTKNDNVLSGAMGLNLGAGNSNRTGQLYQTIATEAGIQYELSGQYTSPQGSSSQRFSAEIFDGVGIGGASLAASGTVDASNNDWQRLSLVFTASSASTTVLVSDQGTVAADNATLALDDFSVVEFSGSPGPIFNNVYFNALLVTAPTYFELWSREQGVVADPLGDINRNGIANLIEFGTGMDELPALESDGLVNLTVRSGAVQDGLTVGIEFSSDLDQWTRATVDTVPVSVSSSNSLANGDFALTFAVDSSATAEVFWRVFAEMPVP